MVPCDSTTATPMPSPFGRSVRNPDFSLSVLSTSCQSGMALRHLDAPLERIPSARDGHLVDEGLGHETVLIGAGRAMRRARDVSL